MLNSALVNTTGAHPGIELFHATISWPTDAAGSEAGACTADDPVDGNPATAAHGVAGTHRAGDGRQPGARPGRVDRERADEAAAEDDDAKPRSSVADTERELVVKDDRNNEDDFERLLNMAENLPDDYEERSRPSMNRIEAEGDRRHDAMANMLARPESLRRLPAPPAELVRDRRCRAADGRPDHLQPRHQRLLEDAARRPAPARAGRTERRLHSASRQADGVAEEALRVVQRLDPPGVGARNAQRVPAAAAHPGHAVLRRAAGC